MKLIITIICFLTSTTLVKGQHVYDNIILPSIILGQEKSNHLVQKYLKLHGQIVYHYVHEHDKSKIESISFENAVEFDIGFYGKVEKITYHKERLLSLFENRENKKIWTKNNGTPLPFALSFGMNNKTITEHFGAKPDFVENSTAVKGFQYLVYDNYGCKLTLKDDKLIEVLIQKSKIACAYPNKIYTMFSDRIEKGEFEKSEDYLVKLTKITLDFIETTDVIGKEILEKQVASKENLKETFNSVMDNNLKYNADSEYFYCTKGVFQKIKFKMPISEAKTFKENINISYVIGSKQLDNCLKKYKKSYNYIIHPISKKKYKFEVYY